MKKRTLSLLLAVLLLLAPLAACGTPDEPAPSGETDPATETLPPDTESDPEPERTFADFPKRDFGGAELRLGDTEQYDIYKFSYREETNGDVLNDAIYDSLRAVEEKLHVVIRSILFADMGQLRDAVTAGDDFCDVMTEHDYTLGNLALDGYTMDVSRLEPIDFTAPWWPESAVRSFLINDTMLLFSNYMSYFGVSRARAWFINKRFCEDIGLTVPYADVFAGTWTLDKLNAMIAAAYSDANGNGIVDKEDNVGYVNQNMFICMQPSLGIYTFAADEEGKLGCVFDLERASAALDKMYSMIYETSGVLQAESGAGRQDQSVFGAGRSLFYYDSLGMAETFLRDSEVDYGILCTPKLDETQADYIAGYTDYLHAVPKTVADTALVGWGIEALTASGYYSIIPAFVDASMSRKYANDPESARVIRLIGEKMYIDIAYIFSANLANTFRTLLDVSDPGKDIAAYYAENRDLDIQLAQKLNSLYGGGEE